MTKAFPVIDPVATGQNIIRLRKHRGLTVRDLQSWFGFEQPQAIYKWQKGISLPSIDNLYALGALLDVPLEEILVPYRPDLNIIKNGQQVETCCPLPLPGSFEYGRKGSAMFPFFSYRPFAWHAPNAGAALQQAGLEMPEGQKTISGTQPVYGEVSRKVWSAKLVSACCGSDR